MDTDNFAAHYNIGITNLTLNRIDKAFYIYLDITKEIKKYDSYEQKITHFALNDINDYIKNNPESIFPYIIRGYLYKEINLIEKANKDLKKFIIEFKGDSKWVNRAKQMIDDKI